MAKEEREIRGKNSAGRPTDRPPCWGSNTPIVMAESSREYLCISCLSPSSAIFKRTDGNFIKLLECSSCGKVVDRYVECEKSIIFMDVMLQEIAAYRHILYNASNFTSHFYMKLAVSLVLSEGYVRWTNFAQGLSAGEGIQNNETYLYIMCILTAVEIGVFGAIIMIYSWVRFPCRPPLYNALLLGQCGRLANIAAIIWYHGSSVIFQGLMLSFVFISSIQSTRAALHIGRAECAVLITVAFITSICSSNALQPLLIGDRNRRGGMHGFFL